MVVVEGVLVVCNDDAQLTECNERFEEVEGDDLSLLIINLSSLFFKLKLLII